ncbi:ROK family transcriptional regulator [Streptomyces sp. R302]|uniref:ROK family protein n=1 Tax=unclassified Streptomyces TaxID=2593676 RepID=UPI00145EF6F3|nr:ROK family transcriptional regulator [Streptomyces sp. R301]NML81607.1 ROK family transcriptional regulator [Streptomyces sp. R302]
MTELVRGTPGLVRAVNDRAALHLLLRQGPLTRPEVSRLTGLSKPTASQVLARLVDAGLVVGNGLRTGLPGRVPETYRVNPEAAYATAVDVSPERVAVRTADITGTVLGETEAPVPARPDREALVTALRTALGRVPAPRPPRSVVVGVQGAVDPTTGRLAYASEEDMAAWLFPDVERTLGEALGLPVRIENDVNLAAVAERAHAAADCPDLVLLWADEGLGAALVIGGRLHRGHFGGAGEVGYLPLPGAPTAREAGDHYGRHGYQELAGGDAVRDLLHAHGVPGADFAEAVTEAVRRAGTSGEDAEAARAGLVAVAARLAAGLASIVTVVDPGLVVLAGRLCAAGGEALRALVERELRVLAHSRARVRLSSVPGNPVLAGALALALTETREQTFGGPSPLPPPL